MMEVSMPQRPLTNEELDQLHDTPFFRLKKILEDRRVPETQLRSSPAHLHQDMHFRLTAERCEFDNGNPYLCITEATNSVGFIFNLKGEMTDIVNYK
jgi:hypothetical protein